MVITTGRLRRRWLAGGALAGCLLAMWLLCTAAALAGSGGTATLPLPGTLNTSGVKLVIDSRWVDATGYRPVRVEIIPLKAPAVRDRQFRVVLKPQTYYSQSRDQISQIVELEQGQMKATGTIPVPQDCPWHAFVIDVFEDGRLHDDLSGDTLSFPRGNYWEWNETAPGILVIDPLAPDLDEREKLLQLKQGRGLPAAKAQYDKQLPNVRNLIRRFPGNNQFAGNGNYVTETEAKNTHALEVLDELKDTVKADILPFGYLPERWIELTAFDLIVIKLADLVDLSKQRPQALRALADWLRAGQTLIVYNTGEDLEGLGQIEQLLQLSPQPEIENGKYRNWKQPNPKDRGKKLDSLVEDGRYGRPTVYPQPGTTTTVTIQQPGEGAVATDWKFVTRPAGLGNVVAFARDPFPGTERDWDWALNSIPGSSWNPTQRLGASMQQRNEDFWNFLIPGTGQAPVLSFLVFITLFVVVIGPVNYYMLQRRRRLYLLLLTVPAGALFVTLSLFVYAMLTDGLGVKSRVRSYTTIDQKTGNAASTSRQAYYASLAPSRGLLFEDDTTIHPFVHEPMTRTGTRTVRRIVNWSDHEQQLKGGYLSSRTLSQLLISKSGPTKAKLRVGAKQGGKLTVTNELEGTLAYLVVTDEEGNYFLGENVKPGAAQLSPVELNVAAIGLSQRLHAVRPDFPEGYDAAMHDSQFDLFNFGGRYYGPWGRYGSQTNQSDGLLERKLARFGQLSSNPLEPNSYVAFAEQSPLVPLGARTRQYGSLHVIEGNY